MHEIILAGIVVLIIGYPIVTKFDKWKKEMTEDENNEQRQSTSLDK